MLADTTNDTTKPCVEEIYEAATNTSNLKQEAERRTAADVLRDMAMSADRLGASLLRLRGQWEQAEKPRRRLARTPRQFIDAGLVRDRETAELAHLGEKAMYDSWHQRETARLVSELGELRAVSEAVAVQAVKWGIRDAEGKAAAVVRYWLDQNCPSCDGTKWELFAGTNRQSTKMCHVCRGSGVAQVPHGQEGRRLANYMDQCLHRHGQKRAARRKAFQAMPTLDKLSKRMQPDAREEAD
jgi:hypothetical protein